jgi:hypothetical protein
MEPNNSNVTTEVKPFSINGKEYKLKEKYSLKDWGGILNILSGMDMNGNISSVSILLAGDKINNLLNIMLDSAIEGDIYEEDFADVSRAINDFFSRKKSLMKNTPASSAN